MTSSWTCCNYFKYVSNDLGQVFVIFLQNWTNQNPHSTCPTLYHHIWSTWWTKATHPHSGTLSDRRPTSRTGLLPADGRDWTHHLLVHFLWSLQLWTTMRHLCLKIGTQHNWWSPRADDVKNSILNLLVYIYIFVKLVYQFNYLIKQNNESITSVISSL